MEQYKSNVAAVMEYLKDEGFSASTISLHKLCYQELEDFPVATDQPHSFDAASQWIAVNCFRVVGNIQAISTIYSSWKM